MLLESRPQNINARRRSGSALIFVSARQHVLISDNFPVRKNYFDSNIVQNENTRLRPRFSKDYFEADIDRRTFLHTTSAWREMCMSSLSKVIYHKTVPLSIGSMGKTLTSC